MPSQRSLPEALRKRLDAGDLPFRDFMEMTLYDSDFGYYAQARHPVGKGGDYVTGPSLSPAFSFAVARLVREFLRRTGDAVSTIVDVGCGDGSLIRSLADEVDGPAHFYGVDRSNPSFVPSVSLVPSHQAQLVLSNELFDALPFARLVQRGNELHELTVTRDLDWGERPAAQRYVDYFRKRGITLEDGQFADVSLEWESLYAELCRFVQRGLIVTFDYGYPQDQLFRYRLRRWGTAAAYSGQRVSRDLLGRPGEQDVTAHINFGDLQHTGEENGFDSLFFARQAKFLLGLGITEHELFRPFQELESRSAAENVELLDRRDEARRLVLPDGIGEDIRVLVQGRGMGEESWSFQRALF